jgi:hypothetical protein
MSNHVFDLNKLWNRLVSYVNARLQSLSDLTEDDIREVCDFEEGMNEENVIPKASADLLGCVKVGDGLNVDESGVLSLLPAVSSETFKGNTVIGNVGIHWGYETPSIAANSGTDVTVIFKNAYKNEPVVLCTTVENTNFFNLFPSGVKSVTKTGAILRVQNTYSAADTIGVMWIAIGEVS